MHRGDLPDVAGARFENRAPIGCSVVNASPGMKNVMPALYNSLAVARVLALVASYGVRVYFVPVDALDARTRA